MAQALEYTVTLRGEDGMEFTTSFTADDRDHVRELVEEYFPESSVIEIMSPADLRAREQDLYDRANDMYDDPTLDDYDY